MVPRDMALTHHMCGPALDGIGGSFLRGYVRRDRMVTPWSRSTGQVVSIPPVGAAAANRVGVRGLLVGDLLSQHIGESVGVGGGSSCG